MTDNDYIEAAELIAGITIVKPDDQLIFRFGRILTGELADEITKRIAARLPDMNFIVIGSDIELFVIRDANNDE